MLMAWPGQACWSEMLPGTCRWALALLIDWSKTAARNLMAASLLCLSILQDSCIQSTLIHLSSHRTPLPMRASWSRPSPQQSSRRSWRLSRPRWWWCGTRSRRVSAAGSAAPPLSICPLCLGLKHMPPFARTLGCSLSPGLHQLPTDLQLPHPTGNQPAILYSTHQTCSASPTC
jgi:hypothetical protein